MSATQSALSSFTDTHLSSIEGALSSYLNVQYPDHRQTLRDAMHYSLTAPAKRFRPLLTLASGRLFQEDVSSFMPLACAIEMIHTYSLIHDDLPDMDDDDVRRGQPTCHIKYGNDMAILAGDTLNSFAFEVLSKELPQHFPADRVLKAIQYFAHACGINGLAGGQAMDLRNDTQNAERLEGTHRRKTGALIKACVVIPTLLASEDPAVHDALDAFGGHLGMLFQITDDILDVTQESDVLGKTANKDTEQNKLTYVALYGLDKACELKDEEASKAHACLDQLTGYNGDVLHDMIKYIQRRTH